MTLRYFLLHTPTMQQGITEAASVGWIDASGAEPIVTAPEWCDLIPTTAYKSMGVTNEAGEIVTPAELAPGAWFLASIQGGDPPPQILPRIASSCEAGKPLTMPAGVVAISPILSGMA